ncbi:kinase-like domain-containing protein [Gigaspora rosea]|uniref:Kinase-like domain-containing protein n=1 Tax=Gigaspora rosea TaxID=44941 RepID=A0A397V4Z5_9GLOM|nr:kinase-like domain-containing protein [Gigaspora rosea]
MVGRWVKVSENWTEETNNRSKRVGSGRRAFYPEAERILYTWVIEQRKQALAITYTALQNKIAEILQQPDMALLYGDLAKNFKASHPPPICIFKGMRLKLGEQIPPDIVVWHQLNGWIDTKLMIKYAHLDDLVKAKFRKSSFDLAVIPSGLTSGAGKTPKRNLHLTNEWIHNSEIHDDLKKILVENKYQISWISYNEFKNIKEIDKGEFATVYYANWYDKNQYVNRSVALKLLHKSNNYHEEFISKLKAYCDIGLKDLIFLKCFGISKDIGSKDYIIVMNYAPLELWITARILPYIAPEVLNKQLHSKASDIYSFGIIMWEILYGKPVHFGQDSKLQSKIQFQIQVCGGSRPPVHENTAICYVDLMKKCWHTEPEK